MNKRKLSESDKALIVQAKQKLRMARYTEGISIPILSVIAEVSVDTGYAFMGNNTNHGVQLSTYLRLVDALGYEVQLVKVKDPKQLEETPDNLRKLQTYRTKKSNRNRKTNGKQLSDGKVKVRLPRTKKLPKSLREEYDNHQAEEDFLCSPGDSA